MKYAVVALVLLLLLEVPALYAVATTQSEPANQTLIQPQYSYSDATNFSFQASVAPNPLYNISSIGPGQGTIFLALTRTIALSYDYTLAMSAPSTVIARTGWTTTIDGGLWNRTLNFSGLGPVQSATGVTSYSIGGNFTVNVSAVLHLVEAIQNATGYNSPSPIVEFHPIVYVIMQPAGQAPLSVLYSPQLNLTFGSTAIQPGPLSASSGGSRTTTSVMPVAGVATDRELAIAVATVVGIAAILAAYSTTRQAITDRRKNLVARTLRQMTAPYQEAIAMTGTPPSNTEMVGLGTWEGLVRVADMLGKPILRYEQKAPDGEWRYFFYVIDGTTQYAYLLPRKARLLAAEDEGAPPN